MKKLLLVFITLPLYPMQKALTKETTYLVHNTRFFPKDGTMIAGSLFRLENKGELEELPLPELYSHAERCLTGWKNVLHWSVNSLVYHGKLPEGHAPQFYCYVIIEPLCAFKQTLRGYWQGVFHIGGHTLSKQAIILVPEGDTQHEDYVGEFKGTLHTYQGGTLRKAVEDALESKGVSVLYPDDEQLCHAMDTEQKVRLGKQLVSSQEIASCIGLDNCLVGYSTVGCIQGMFKSACEPARFFLFMVTVKECVSKLLTEEEFANVHTSMHQTYLAKLKNDDLAALLKVIDDMFVTAKGEHDAEGELQKLKAYQRYIKTLLIYLYGKKKKFVAHRVKYNVATIEGFRAYCKVVHAAAEQFAKAFQGP